MIRTITDTLAYNATDKNYDIHLPGGYMVKYIRGYIKNSAWTTDVATVFTVYPLHLSVTGTIVEGSSLGTFVTSPGDTTTTTASTAYPTTYGPPILGNSFRVKASPGGTGGSHTFSLELWIEVTQDYR